jgi:GAF domain-containing protein
MKHLQEMIVDLAKGQETIENVYNAMCREIVRAVGSTRASIWLFNMTHDAIVCQSLFDIRTGEYTSAIRLTEEDFPEYFQEIKAKGAIIAPDAHNHPATACFTEAYFMPLDIYSLLDHVAVQNGQQVAVLCCEHCGDIREWTQTDESFLRQMAVILAITFKYRSHAA